MGRRFRHGECLVERLGSLPGCLGHYAAGDPECDRPPPCTWAVYCRAYRDSCARRGVDPAKERAELPPKLLAELVDTALCRPPRGKGGHRHQRQLAAWEMFAEAFRQASGVRVAQVGAAEPGEVVYHEWRSPSALFRARAAKVVLADGTLAPGALWRYWPTRRRVVQPTIEYACPLRDLLAAFPEAARLGERWQRQGPEGRGGLGAAVLGLRPERIGDAGRLAARLLERGLLAGARVVSGGWVRL